MSTRDSALVTAIVGALFLSGATLLAHDLWIEPNAFALESGDSASLRLRVGQNLLGDPVARDTALIKQFIVEDASGRKPVVGRAGADPAGIVRAAEPGLLVVGYYSNPSAVDLSADTFNQYVKEEGLDAVATERARRRETASGVHELFTRCAKSLLLSGPPSETQRDRSLGFPLELVAERNPYTVRADQDLPIRLTYDNRPLAGALVVALNRLRLPETLSARSDAEGRVRFRLRPGGMWLIKAVHMIPAPAGTNADWVSFWASLTFGSVTPTSSGR
jgi:uncharacterized GH25 family protein